MSILYKSVIGNLFQGLTNEERDADPEIPGRHDDVTGVVDKAKNSGLNSFLNIDEVLF
jgi:hypothetical protein